MAVFNNFFRGRPSPSPAKTTFSPPLASEPDSAQATRAPPSSFKFAPPPSASPSSSTSTPTSTTASPSDTKKPAVSKSSPAFRAKDFAASSYLYASEPPYPPPDRPLPPAPGVSPLKGRSRSSSTTSSGSERRVATVFQSPKQRAPPVTFTPPRSHARTASGPSLNRTPGASLRQRAATLQNVTSSTGSTPTSTPSKVVKPSPLAQAAVLQTPPRPSVPATTTPLSGSTGRKRPAALKLKTSNLSPPPSPTATKGGGAETLLKHTQTQRSTATVSSYYFKAGTQFQQREATGKGSDSDETVTPESRAKRASLLAEPSALGLSLDLQPKSTDSPDKRKQRRHSVKSSMGSIPFEKIPLPWSSSPAAELSAEMGSRFDAMVDYTVESVVRTPPRLLRPSVLRTSAKEDHRLRAELERLRLKYDALVSARDSLLSQLAGGEGGGSHTITGMQKMVETVRKATARCDRVARQIYICNDQIRQIELQGEEHVVGALRVVLERKLRPTSATITVQAPLISEPTSPLPSSVLQSAELEELVSEADSTMVGDKGETDTDQEQPVIRRVYFAPPPDTNSPQEMDKGKRQSIVSKRFSTATIISLNHLGFPLPPERSTSPLYPSSSSSSSAWPQTPPPGPTTDDRLKSQPLEVDVRPPMTARSASMSLLLGGSPETQDEILIYPPNHRRSLSAPLLSPTKSALSNSFAGLDLPETPWKTYSNVSPTKIPSGRFLGTAPLRVKGSPRRTGKAQSMKHKRISSELTRRAKKGRESQLEMPESILLSLATADLWTKPEIIADM